jgi:starch synthase
VNGLLVPPGDPPAVADAITTLLADADRRRAMGNAGRKRVRDAHGVDRLVADVDRLYSELVEGARS